MRQEKTQKRLVTKAQYVRVLGKKLTIYSFSSFVLLCGLIGLLCAFVLGVMTFLRASLRASDRALMLLAVFFVGGLSCVLLRYSRSFFVEGNAIEPVEPITRHNTNLLPAEETLVRGSTEPPGDQQAQSNLSAMHLSA